MFIVNGIEWNLAYVDPYSDSLRRSDGSLTLGVTDNEKKIVFVNNRLCGKMLDKVLSHEMCHVFSFSYNCQIDIDTEEIVADFLATYGRDIFRVADELLQRFTWRIA